MNIRGDRLYHEHILWDSASVLVQLGLMPEYVPFPYKVGNSQAGSPDKGFEVRVPAAGDETSKKMRDKNSVESNAMFAYKIRGAKS